MGGLKDHEKRQRRETCELVEESIFFLFVCVGERGWAEDGGLSLLEGIGGGYEVGEVDGMGWEWEWERQWG